MVPETEAPSEFNLFFPDKNALCISECATHCLHNIVTLRGALVRDAKRWSKYLDETIALYGHQADVLFSGHHWPTWEQAKLVQLISEQRDLYAYLHDQTIRLMNQGLTGIEIAEQFRLPSTLQRKWHTQGYYGSISHNVKGIYQRYMTWFDGNPANLWKLPPAEEGKRYVACMGGIDAVVSKARIFVAEDDLRFAATLLDHAVASEPKNDLARTELANVYEKLGYGAENGTWRNFYLTGAAILRKPPTSNPGSSQRTAERTSLASINPQSSIENWLDALAVQLDGQKAGGESSSRTVNIRIPDEKNCWTLRLSNGALTNRSQLLEDKSLPAAESVEKADLSVALSKDEVYKLLSQGSMADVEKTAEGDTAALRDILELCGVLQFATAQQGRL
jgi:alkyl sulfatase BDS1-like metallo-beta-lactamase superfamily hydrolase